MSTNNDSNKMPALRLSETIREEAKSLINEKIGGWGMTTLVDGLHTDFTQEALELFIDRLVDKGRTILGIASGIAVMKGLNQVTSMEIEQAVLMSREGLSRALPQVRQRDAESE